MEHMYIACIGADVGRLWESERKLESRRENVSFPFRECENASSKLTIEVSTKDPVKNAPGTDLAVLVRDSPCTGSGNARL
ncbi:hypothetical protein FA13DRAFT_1724049 [Coprinellus micaceus]|uniref:Uncharacterized protein n=1 Tax=Coprinellus micaceus TaxID=71717 RepID=A0A4Y7U089_COPMI|nr:hypothetical protein FA13DRAFT_1724049 [Coprinellus micaceus]